MALTPCWPPPGSQPLPGGLWWSTLLTCSLPAPHHPLPLLSRGTPSCREVTSVEFSVLGLDSSGLPSPYLTPVPCMSVLPPHRPTFASPAHTRWLLHLPADTYCVLDRSWGCRGDSTLPSRRPHRRRRHVEGRGDGVHPISTQ